MTTSASNWIVGTAAVHGNPYDGSTLSDAIAQTHRLSGVLPKQVAVDRGFRGSKHHPEGLQVLVAGARKFKEVLKRLAKRRSAIEPVIGHLKHDHALKRNFLKGKQGDCINALMAAYGFNLRKLCRCLSDDSFSRSSVLSILCFSGTTIYRSGLVIRVRQPNLLNIVNRLSLVVQLL
ncbi:hypothetical protein S7335_47 [Synechococcus sp. PCC 7335]|nr:hypothetical protein S7335_47 [Synechococcus sp. PCC 7335]